MRARSGEVTSLDRYFSTILGLKWKFAVGRICTWHGIVADCGDGFGSYSQLDTVLMFSNTH
jgi:hypothetical protein